MHTVALATGALAVVPFLAADAPGSTYHYVDGKNFKLEEYVRLAQPDGAQDCPYLSQNVPGTMASPCFQADCAADSDGCPCLLYQMEYCAQPEVLAADPNCGASKCMAWLRLHRSRTLTTAFTFRKCLFVGSDCCGCGRKMSGC
eukprot:SAG31_NODE_7849_length_1583_cov_1.601078_1_plen_143_part_01